MITIKDLNKIREKKLCQIKLRKEDFSIEKGIKKTHPIHVMVCGGTGCHSSKGDEIRILLEEKVKENELEDEIKVVLTGCFGLCESGPNIVIYPDGIFYSHVKLEDIDEIVEKHFVKGEVVKRLLFEEAYDKDEIVPVNEVNFYKKQERVALRNCGLINPEDIEEYI